MQKEGQRAQQVIDQLFDGNSSPPAHCGQELRGLNSSSLSAVRHSFLASSVALVVLSYHAPRTLLNSMLTWQQGGLLGIMREKVALLNDPLPEEEAIARAFGFKVVQPQDIPAAKTARRNVLTIGAAFYYALQLVESEFVLFLENDFKLDLQYDNFKVSSRQQGSSKSPWPLSSYTLLLIIACSWTCWRAWACCNRASS